MQKYVSISKVAEYFGVCNQTIRNWCEEGHFKNQVLRTKGGHRRFCIEIIKEVEDKRKVYIYSRVSSYDQKDDLGRQVENIKNKCEEENIEVLSEIASGINPKRRQFKKLLKEVIVVNVKKIYVSYKDRLMRFGGEIFSEICKLQGTEIQVVNEEKDKEFERQLVEDVLAIMTVYTARIHGKRKKHNCEKRYGFYSVIV